MEPSHILRSDALDILFEHRNKQYGAYALRRNYPRHLLAGLGAMVLLVILAMVLSGFYRNGAGSQTLVTTCIFQMPEALELSALPPRPSPALKPLTPTPPAPNLSKQPEADKLATPVIVKDDPSLSLIDQLKQAGDLDRDAEPTPATENGDGSGNVDGPGNIGGSGISSGQGAPAAPVAPPAEEFTEMLDKTTVMPAFPGGTEALKRWLSRQLRPQDGQESGTRTRVVVRFLVDSRGEISRVQLARSAGEPFDTEVLRVLNKMPRWIPGQQNGRPVSLWFTIPVIFETPEQ